MTSVPTILSRAALIVCVMLAACKKAAPPSYPPPDVTVLKVKPEKVEAKLDYVGQAEASKAVEVRSQVTGVIVARPYTEGTDVAKGTVLYRIDPTIYEAALRSAEGTLANAQARLANAQRNVNRVKPLLAEHAVAQVDVDNAETELQQARAGVDQARGAVDEARKNYDDTFVRAQISGRAGRALLVLGARVTGPSDLLTTVEQVDPIYVSFNPSDRDVLAWRHNEATRKMIATGKLKVAITLSDKSTFPHLGVVNFVDQSLQYNTGTLLLRATVPNPEHILLPGQFVRVKPLGITRDSALLVPQRAVQQGLSGTFVYLLGPNNTAMARDVSASTWDGGRWLIDEGLKPGDQVIVDGTLKVGPGRPVHPTPYDAAKDSTLRQSGDTTAKVKVGQ
ncbi:MAG TPA: efflux RND transporter periplasmic adaptor subunit [Gemmatimonadaceae bacterium]|nr:efflux RND transporter periplasmic adaptor subunit [Gemmatimonadaceae bacterium]